MCSNGMPVSNSRLLSCWLSLQMKRLQDFSHLFRICLSGVGVGNSLKNELILTNIQN